MLPTEISLGVAGAIGAEKVARLAPHLEEAGFRTLWINETPGVNALDVAAAAARETDALRVATGVIPVDERPSSELLDDIARLEIPEDRLTLGIGSGRRRAGALAMIDATLAELREATSARLVVGALGPKMRALAARASDGVLLNWLPPEAAAAQTREFHAANPDGAVSLYVRTNADPSARARLEKEARRYEGLPAYGANFARLGVGALDTALPRPGEDDPRPGRDAYRGAVDEIVLRAVTPADAVEEFLAFLPLAR
ncbi:LLM class flavin-dependent oxidoreductase [Microbacterium sp. gxy059]|uniref:LLM class flavin-dependent oxidoreductase n=1 Tax=Microbacterium sp. gxy059 TaxID=2957199 RepID=UPI003D98B5E1